jgi:predicted nuclease with TOPRIM domain
MSVGDFELADASTSEEIKRYIRGLENRLESHSTQLDELREENAELRQTVGELEDENERLRSRADDIEGDVAELDSRTDLLQVLQQPDEMDGEQRSVALILHLKRAAEHQKDRPHDSQAKAEITPEEAERVLQYPDIDRTTIYSDMERAERLVGDKSVLWYHSGGYGDTSLRINLEAGDLPGTVTGRE